MENRITALNAECAYVKGNPITVPEAMPRPLPRPELDERWRELLKEKWWATNARESEDTHDPRCRKLLALRDRLLSFGGTEACLSYDDSDFEAIMERGQLWYGDRMRLVKGEAHRCHGNSAALWARNKDMRIATGYALADDGMWREHTWCILLRKRGNLVVETTVRCLAYFGFVLTQEEAEEFAALNY